jgi:hypothetical protein
MRTPSVVWRLTFLLPPAIGLLAAPGRHSPCLHGCVLTIDRAGVVAIEGPSRECVFDQATRFLRVNSKGRPPYAVAASVYCPEPRGRDDWSIVVGAEIAFSRTSLPPQIMPEQRAG